MNEPVKSFSNFKTIFFVFIVCLSSGLILSLLATILKKPQLDAETLFTSKQLLLSARILSPEGGFLLQNKEGSFTYAAFDKTSQTLKFSPYFVKAKSQDILTLYNLRVIPKVTNNEGDLLSFKEANLDETTYITSHEKSGYFNLPYKLLYVISPNLPPSKLKETPEVYGYVIPINGFGLWDAIYGFLCLGPDANTVIGTTWYNQKETPGLGAEISTYKWQQQFFGKEIFKVSADGNPNFSQGSLGIKILKTTVATELGSSPSALNAVDGIAGATITSNGVTEGYRQSLTPYRAFLIKAHNSNLTLKKSS